MNMHNSPKDILELMLGHLGLVCEVTEETRAHGLVLKIETREPELLIGKGGRTLRDLQYLLNRILTQEEGEHEQILLDVHNYRSQLESDLLKRVAEAITEAKSTGREVILPPLNAYDRRLVHNFCKQDGTVESISPQDDARLKRITLRAKAGAA
jgi:spoIIIJ-associated protein